MISRQGLPFFDTPSLRLPALVRTGGPVVAIPELQQGSKLLHVVERWLRVEKQERLRRAREQPTAEQAAAPKPKHPLMPSKHMAFFR